MDCLPPLFPEYLDGTASLTSAGRELGTHGGMYKPTTDSTADCTP